VLEESFCNYGCYGIDRLLCCTISKAKALASKCFSSQATLQTIVIHNDDKYGGAGYTSYNVATTSTHPDAGLVAVHELGHSLFELGDEYNSGSATAQRDANCDVAGCPKWSDLSNRMGMNLCKPSACQRGEYFAGADSFMWYLNSPVGEVNLRFTCCTYLALTKSVPLYCDRFEFGKGLLDYCKRDYQGYGNIYETLKKGRETSDKQSSLFDIKYLSVKHPTVILVNIVEETFIYLEQHDTGGPKLYLRRQVFGDYSDAIAAKTAGITVLLKITVIFESGLKQEIIFNPTVGIDVPPGENNLDTKEQAGYASPTEEIVVDGKQGGVKHMDVELIQVDTIIP